jgi:hypothetical protein
MGEIADMMLDGELDFFTGEYIGKGYPRTLDRSLPWERGYNKKAGNYGGVVNFCMQKGKTQSKANDIIKRYGKEKFGIDVSKASGSNSFKEEIMPLLVDICNRIQSDFNSFRIWFNNITPP